MKFGGYEIKSCPCCTQLYKDRVVHVKNFSDGYVEGDWIPKFTTLVKCVNEDCGKFFNLNDQNVIAEIAFEERDSPEWKSAHNTSDCKMDKKKLEEALTSDFCKLKETKPLCTESA